MSATAHHPARPLFDSNFVPGLLTKIVLEEHAKEPDLLVDIPRLKEGYAAIGCPNIVRIVEFIESELLQGSQLTEFGSGTLDLDGVTSEEFTMDRALSLQELYIGNHVYKILPLPWLAYQLRGIERVPKELLPHLDIVCKDLMDFMDAAK